MRQWLLATWFLAGFGCLSWADEPPKATRAADILEAWRSTSAAPSERCLHVVCWTPADRAFPPRQHERLSRIMKHIQNFYAQEMDRNGFGQRSFPLQLDGEGKVVLVEVRGKHPTSHYGSESGNEIREECLPVLREKGIEADQETIAIFCNLANWDEKTLTFTSDSPYYAGGTYRSGTAWQLDSPELDTENLPAKEPIVHDAQYGDISLGKHNSIFIGGIAHELGHALGLPHCKERFDELALGTSLMGSGNRTYGDETRGEGAGSFLPFVDALRLASHPLFCGKLETSSAETKSSLTNLMFQTDGRAIAVSGEVSGTPPVYGVVAYFDPAENGDYDQTWATAVPAADGKFELRSGVLPPGKLAMLRLVPLHANGAIGNGGGSPGAQFSYRVGENGRPNLKLIEIRQALLPVVEALQQKQVGRAARLAKKITIKEAAAIAERLVDDEPPKQTPAQFARAAGERSLTSFRADVAEVGWMSPSFNVVPDLILLESSGEIFATGIYAHAPARHTYTLGGKWDQFRGQVGIAAGQTGTVQFEIKGDGRSLWQSPVVAPDTLVPFDVDVKGVSELELIASPTDDGKGGDWGLWLEPKLIRSK